MSTIHITELIPAYVLGILDQAEQDMVLRHLSQCASCQDELCAYQNVTDCLAEAVPQRTPPTRLRAAILQKASTKNPPRRAGLPVWLAWLTQPMRPMVGLVGLVVILILAGINLSLWQQSQHPTAPVPTVQTEFRLVHMAAPQNGNATGLLAISDEGTFGTLVVDGLDPLEQSKQYQLWLIKDGKRTSGGVFSVQDNGYGVLKIDSPMPLIEYQSFGVTIEPFGGSPGPTGQKVLGGNL